jgi:hypothetical protein
MRIIKAVNTDRDVELIADEMINIEASAELFREGKYLAPKETGYPRFRVAAPGASDGIEYRARATEAVIYVGTSRFNDIAKLELALIKALDRRERMLTGTPFENHLGNFQTVKAGFHTNIKTKCENTLTAPSTSTATNGIKRKFMVGNAATDAKNYRFSWIITPIYQFDYRLDNLTTNALARFVNSIFYDVDNISMLENSVWTVNFSAEKLVGYKHALEDTLLLSTYYHPVALEVNKYWNQNLSSFAKDAALLEVHRNINPSKVFERDFKDVKLRPTSVAPGDNRDDVCSRCHEPLYDDIYVLSVPIATPDYQLGIPVCPLCMHLTEKRLENKYLYVFRVKYPRTIQAVINSMSVSPAKKAVMLAALRGVKSHTLPATDIHYWSLGDEYLLFQKLEHYLYSPLSTQNTKPVLVLDLRAGNNAWFLDLGKDNGLVKEENVSDDSEELSEEEDDA